MSDLERLAELALRVRAASKRLEEREAEQSAAWDKSRDASAELWQAIEELRRYEEVEAEK